MRSKGIFVLGLIIVLSGCAGKTATSTSSTMSAQTMDPQQTNVSVAETHYLNERADYQRTKRMMAWIEISSD